MIRLFFILFTVIHTLIHLMGFVKGFGWAELKQLTQPVSRVRGLIWLSVSLLFALSLSLFIGGSDSWWISAILSVTASQILLFFHWKDARFGTIANIIILIAAIIGYGEWRFHGEVQEELDLLVQQTQKSPQIIREDSLTSLPPIIRQWLKQANCIGKENIQTVHLFQSGKMKTRERGEWVSFTAQQWFSAAEPGFVWSAHVGAGSLLQFAGRDILLKGKGNMLIKIFSLFNVVNARGEEIDQGAILRYLAETVWFPSAILNSCISWTEISPLQARAKIKLNGITATGVFSFNQHGDVKSFEAMRYYSRAEGSTLEKWFISVDENSYKTFAGIRIPTKALVTWKLKSGDFNWLRLKIDDIHYNPAYFRY